MIELVAAVNTDRPFAQSIESFLQTNREGLYALVLQSEDLQTTAETLASHGISSSTAADSDQVLEVDQAATAGALIRIERAD